MGSHSPAGGQVITPMTPGGAAKPTHPLGHFTDLFFQVFLLEVSRNALK